MEAIILAGGLGTRLKDAVPLLPKSLAPVNGRPFIGYILDYLQTQGITKFIFALGYKSAMIESFLKTDYPELRYAISFEDEPLGTGGAIAKAMHLAKSEMVFVTNGDTLYKASLHPLVAQMQGHSCSACLCLKPMQHFSRYGTVEINEAGLLTSFNEKQYCKDGLINGGIYLINKSRFLTTIGASVKFSFEEQFLLPAVKQNALCGVIDNGYFIDIGIPEDFERASAEL